MALLGFEVWRRKRRRRKKEEWRGQEGQTRGEVGRIEERKERRERGKEGMKQGKEEEKKKKKKRKSWLSLLVNLKPIHKEKMPFGRVVINTTRKISSQIPHKTNLLTSPPPLTILKGPETNGESEYSRLRALRFIANGQFMTGAQDADQSRCLGSFVLSNSWSTVPTKITSTTLYTFWNI